MPLSDETCYRTVIIAMILTSSITIFVGIYIGLTTKSIILSALGLVVIGLVVALISEVGGLFTDKLNKKQRKEAISLDIHTLK